MKKLLLLLIVSLFSVYTMGQNSVENYAFSTATNASLTDMSSGTTVLIPGPSDVILSPITNIGFNFIFMGVPYAQFSVNSDGQLRFGTTLISTAYSSPGSGVPLLVPISGDNYILASGKVHYKVSGSAPNQVLIVEWKDLRIPTANSGNPSTIQVRIYEATGAVEYVYGSVSNNLTLPTPTRAIWMSSSTAAFTVKYIGSDLISAINSSTAVTFPLNDANTALLNSAADGSRRIYSFTPNSAPLAPTSLTFSSVTATTMTLNWIDNATNETGYAIYRSIDGGVTYNYITTLAVNSITYGATGLFSGNTYYWRVYALNEGNGAYVQASQATSAAATKTSAGSGNWNTAATWSPSGVPTATDNVVIADDHTVIIDAAATCRDLTVGQGVSGILRYGTTAVTLTVNNNLTIAANGLFDAGVPAGASLTHTLNIGGSSATSLGAGNLTVNGDFKMYIGSSNGKANVYFYGVNNAAISGTGTNLDFYTVYLNKGAVAATPFITPPILDIQRAFTVQGANTVGLITTHTAGVLKISGSYIQGNPLYAAAAYSIPSLGGLWLNNANFTVTALAGSPTSAGLFRITSGTYNIGTASGQSMQLSSGSVIIIEGGAVNAVGRFAVSAVGNTTYYNQSAGIMTVQTIGHASATYYGFDLGTSSSSNFTMSGGSIEIVKGASGYDYRGPTAGGINITGGSLQFGNASSGAVVIPFKMLGSAPTTILSVATANHTLTLAGNTTIYGDLSIPLNGTFSLSTLYQLIMKGYSLAYPGNITNAGTLTMNGGSSSELVFNGIWGDQSLTNTGTITGSAISKLTIANFSSPTATVTVPSVSVNAGAGSSAALTLTQGTLACSGTLTLGGGAGTGGFTLVRTNGSLAATPTFSIGTGTISYTYNGTSAQTTGVELPALISTLIINNPWGVTLNSALSIYNATSLVGVLTLTNGVLGNAANLTLGGGGTHAFTFSAAYGSLSGVPTLNYGTGTNAFTYNGTIAQATGGELPALVSTLTINNAAGVTLNRNLQVGTTFTMNSGNFLIGTNNLTLGTAAATAGTLTYTSGLIVTTGGTFKRWFPTSGLPTVVGSSIGYFPMGVYVGGVATNRQLQLAFSAATALSSGGTIEVLPVHDQSLTTGLSIVDGAYTITRRANSSWTLTNTGCALSGTAIMRLGGTGAFTTTAFANMHLMQGAAVVGTHSAGTGTNAAPQANRTALATADLSNTYYIGAADADISGTIYSASTGDWNAGGSWVGGIIPASTDNVIISSTHNISVTTAASALNVTVNTGGTLTINAGANLTVTGAATTGIINNGTLVANDGTMTLGPAGGGDRTFLNSGTLTVAGGTLNINGNLNIASGSTFNQSGGNIKVDGNAAGVTGSSVAAATALVMIATNNGTVNGGTLTIVDPPAAISSARCFQYSTSSIYWSWPGHTLKFGDGSSTDASANANGFEFDCYVGSGRLLLGNVVVDGGSTTNHWGCTSSAAGNGSYIGGNLTINSGSEFRNISGGAELILAGNLTNNGTYIAITNLNLATVSGSSVGATPNAQTIGGSGVYRNLAASSTASLTSLTVNNSSTGGVTLNVPLSMSGTLTLTLGNINTTASNLLILGTASAAGTLTGGSVASKIIGPFARTFASGRTASGTYTTATLFPVGKSTAYLPVWIDPTTSAGGAVIMTGEAFTSNSGTMGAGVTTLSSNRWEVLVSTGAANLTNSFIQINDAGIVTGNQILQATEAGGVYGAIPVASNYTAGPPVLLTTGSAIVKASLYGYFAYGMLTPCTAPVTQPTALVTTYMTATSFTGSFTAAGAPAPSNYLVVRYASGGTPTNPVNYTAYTVGAALGTGTVRYIGTGTTFDESGLTLGTTYDYYIYSYNNSGCYGPVYNTTSPLYTAITTCGTAIGAPGIPTSSLITSSGFTASWAASSTPGVTYIIDVATDAAFTSYVGVYNHLDVGTDLTKEVTPLSSATTYYVRVRANSGGTCYSAYTSTLTVTTECNAEAAPTVVQDFSTYTGAAPPPLCWKEATGTLAAPSTLTYGSSKWTVSSGFANTGSNKAVKTNLYGTYSDWIISQPIDLGGTPGLYRVKYLMAVTGYNTTTAQSTLGTHKVDIVVSTDGGATWSSANSIKTYTGIGTYSNTGQTELINLAGYSGIVRIAFVQTTSSTSPDIDFHIDDFQVEAIPEDPILSVVPSSLDFGYKPSGGTSSEKTYLLSGLFLTGFPGQITVTAPSNFEVSKLGGGAGFGPSVQVDYSGATLTDQTIFVRFKPTTPGTPYSGNISNAGGGATTVNVAVTGTSLLTYCAAGATTCDEYISRVQIGTIDNATACTSGGYADYTAMSTDMSIGGTYAITVTNGTPEYDTDQCGVWIDWNQNGLFTDADETITVTGTPGGGPYTANIVPPVGATSGSTRMRVRICYTSGLSSCGTASYGEVEDYNVNVVAATPMTFVSSTTTQTNTGVVAINSTNQEIIGIQIVTTGTTSPLSATSFTLGNSSTALGDISNATIYYTGGAAVFSATGLFGSQTNPPLSYTITGTQELVTGTNYFWVAYDISPSATPLHTADAECTSLTVAGVAHTPDVTAPGGGRQIRAALSGTYTIGASQVAPNYTNLTNAISELNILGVSSAVTFQLASDYSSAVETFPLIINPISGGSAINTLTIKPAADVTATITGSAAAQGVIILNGCDYVTIDGSNAGRDDKSLTIANLYTTAISAPVMLMNDGTGATNNTIKNCILNGGSISNTNTYGVFLNAGGGFFDRTTIDNNTILNAYKGMQFCGVSGGVTTGGTITNNIIGSAVDAESIGNIGASLSYVDGVTIANNTFQNIKTGTNPRGILLGTGTVNTTVNSNNITGIKYVGTSGYGGKGIDINTGSVTSGLLIYNNTLSNISGDGYNNPATDNIIGIRILGTTGGIDLYHNSVYLSGSIDRASAATDFSACLYVVSTATAINCKDNIFVNTIENTTGVATAYAVYSDAANTAYTDINYNDYYVSGLEGVLGYLGANTPTLTDWQTATAQDVRSVSIDPAFVSTTDLHPRQPLLIAGTAIGGITTDYSGITRVTPPTMGAYELPQVITLAASGVTASAATLNGSVNACNQTVVTSFEYGTTTGYGSSVVAAPTPVTGSATTAISGTIGSGLIAGTLYHFRAVGTVGAAIYNGPDLTFTTAAGSKTIDVTAYLEGPFNGTDMNTTLLDNTLIPTDQPYSGAPWGYEGAESADPIPAGVVDWVLVELRKAATPEEALPGTRLDGWPKAFFLKSDGKIVALDGTSMPDIGNPDLGGLNLYVVVRHRNHLAIMSSAGMELVDGNKYQYNFSASIDQAFGGALGYKEIGGATGIYGMVCADGAAQGEITTDGFTVWATDFGLNPVYLSSDFDMDSDITTDDFTKWATNFGISNPISKPNTPGSYTSQVPGQK